MASPLLMLAALAQGAEPSVFEESPILLALTGGAAALLLMALLRRLLGVAMVLIALVTLAVAVSLYLFGLERTREFAEQAREAVPSALEDAANKVTEGAARDALDG